MSRKSGLFYQLFSSDFFLLTQAEKKGFQPDVSPYFCVGQQKKTRSNITSKKNRYFGTCKLVNCSKSSLLCVSRSDLAHHLLLFYLVSRYKIILTFLLSVYYKESVTLSFLIYNHANLVQTKIEGSVLQSPFSKRRIAVELS